MDMPESDCPELTEKTADIIDDTTLKGLFITTQMNNLSICVKYALKWVSYTKILIPNVENPDMSWAERKPH